MLMIYVTTGHVPVYWRPPFGDTDTRVSAIAKQVRIISFKHHAYMNYLFFLRSGVLPNNCGLE